MIDFTTAQPLGEAVENISTRTPLGSTLNSAEWATVPPEIRMRALFSSRVEEERYLVSMQDKLEQRVRLGRNDGTLMERSRFIAEMQDDLKQFGYEPDPRKRGSIQDISSAGRLGLIWDMNLAQAEGYAAWKMGMDPDMLDAAPAQELIRVANRIEKRPWPAIWREHGGKFYGEPNPDFPDAPGRMMALKTDPIWEAISEFGSPWPPFRWGSGVGLRNVRRREAETLGVLAEGATVKPLDKPFNHKVEASLKGIPEARRQKLLDYFRGDVEIEGDVIRLLPPDKVDASRKGRKTLEKLLPSSTANFIEQPVPAGVAKLVDTVEIPRAEALLAPLVSRQIRKAIEAANKVHDARGNMATMEPIKIYIRRNLHDYGGEFIRGNPPYIIINPDAYHIRMAVWHELAHALDHLSLQGAGERVFASQGQRSMRKVMYAIRDSRAAAALAQRAEKDGRKYWIRDQELFARAYAQFMATATKDASAKKHLQKILAGSYEQDGIWKETQWDDDSFTPIYEAMLDLLTSTSNSTAR